MIFLQRAPLSAVPVNTNFCYVKINFVTSVCMVLIFLDFCIFFIYLEKMGYFEFKTMSVSEFLWTKITLVRLLNYKIFHFQGATWGRTHPNGMCWLHCSVTRDVFTLYTVSRYSCR